MEGTKCSAKGTQVGQGPGQVTVVLQKGGPGRVTEQSLGGQSPDSGHNWVAERATWSCSDGDHPRADGWDTERGRYTGASPPFGAAFAPGPWMELAA